MKTRTTGIKAIAAAALAIVMAATGVVIHNVATSGKADDTNRNNTSIETLEETNAKKSAHSTVTFKAAAASVGDIDGVDYGDLTDEEINILNDTLDQLDKLYSEIYNNSESDAEHAEHEEEIDELEAIADEYMEKAGWFDDDFDDDFLGDFYGDLTDAEIEELNSIFDQIDEINEKIYGDSASLTWEEYEARYEPYEDELNRLYDRMDELSVKAGWYEADTFSLTNEEFDELDDIYTRQAEISNEIYNGDFYISDAEYNRRAVKYQDELDQLNAREAELEAKMGWEFDEDGDAEYYGNLTDEEIARVKELDAQIDAVYAKVYGDADVLTEQEYYERLGQYEDELNKLWEEYDALMENAWDYTPDKGNLTDEEYAEWEALWDREGEIYDEIYGDDYYIAPDEYEKRSAPYQDELDSISDRTYELGLKAGWYDEY